MSDPISSIRNLGPAMEKALGDVGITSAQALRDLGTDAAYAKYLAGGNRPHFIGYYVMEMGLQGRPWNDCKGDEKKILRARFDAIVAQHNASDVKGRSDFEAALDALGVIERPQPTSSRPEKK